MLSSFAGTIGRHEKEPGGSGRTLEWLVGIIDTGPDGSGRTLEWLVGIIQGQTEHGSGRTLGWLVGIIQGQTGLGGCWNGYGRHHTGPDGTRVWEDVGMVVGRHHTGPGGSGRMLGPGVSCMVRRRSALGDETAGRGSALGDETAGQTTEGLLWGMKWSDEAGLLWGMKWSDEGPLWGLKRLGEFVVQRREKNTSGRPSRGS